MQFFDIVMAMKVPGRITEKQWRKLPDNVKRAYVKLHPNSMFAIKYAKEQKKNKKPATKVVNKKKIVVRPITKQVKISPVAELSYKPSSFKELKAFTELNDKNLADEFVEFKIPAQYAPSRSSRMIENRMSDNQTRLATKIFRDLVDSGVKWKSDNNEQICSMLRKKYGRKWSNIEKAFIKLVQDKNSFLNSGLFMYEQPDDIEQNHIKWILEKQPHKITFFDNLCVENQVHFAKNNLGLARKIKNPCKRVVKMIEAEFDKEPKPVEQIKEEKEIPVDSKKQILHLKTPVKIKNVVVQQDKESGEKGDNQVTIKTSEPETVKPKIEIMKQPAPAFEKRQPEPAKPVIKEKDSVEDMAAHLTGKTAKINVDKKDKTPEQVKMAYQYLALKHLQHGNYVHYDDLSDDDWNWVLESNPLYIMQIKEAPRGLVYKIAKDNKDIIKYMTEDSQKKVMEEDGLLLKFIPEPTDAVIKAAVDNNGAAIKFVKDPTEEQQERAVINSIFAIQYIKNPSEKVKEIYKALKEDWDAQKGQGVKPSEMYFMKV